MPQPPRDGSAGHAPLRLVPPAARAAAAVDAANAAVDAANPEGERLEQQRNAGLNFSLRDLHEHTRPPNHALRLCWCSRHK